MTQVLDVGKSSVVLRTTAQTPNTVYTLTFNGILFDYYYNGLASPSVSQLLGWIQPEEEEPPFRLPLMYNFMFEGLRIEDEKVGFLLQRYFEGFQVVWGAIVELIYLLKQSKDPTKLSGKQLRYLSNLIGWAEKFRTILDAIEDSKLRSLISISPQFWKDRGSPDADDGLIGLLTGARRYQLDWFDLRTIIDEMEISEEHEGMDPWMTSVPDDGSGFNDGYEYNLRIVDDGTLNRALVRAAAKLSKPINERVLIVYLYFLDLFEVDGDFEQWTVDGADPTVVGGEMLLTSGAQFAVVSVEFATEWKDYLVSWRARFDSAVQHDLAFRYIDDSNYYAVRITPQADGLAATAELYRLVAGSFTSLNTFTSTPELKIVGNKNYVWRILVANQGSNVHIEVFLDGNKIITSDDPTIAWGPSTSGTLGINNLGNDATIEEVEVLRLPVESDYININSEAV